MKIAGLLLLAMVAGGVMGLLIQAAFLLWGAKLVGIEERSYAKALITAFLGGLASLLIWFVLGGVPLGGALLAFLAGFVVVALIMVPIFKTTFGKALGAAVLAWVLGWVVIGGISLMIAILFFGGVAALF